MIYGQAVPEDGQFVIEADVDEPRRVNMLIVLFGGAVGQARAIIEPGAKSTISSQVDSLSGMVATRPWGNTNTLN